MYNIKIYDNGGKTTDRYTVIINEDVYYMSFNPDRINEICSYTGNIEDFNKFNGKKLNYIPKNLRYKINQLILEYKREKISSLLYGNLYDKIPDMTDGEIEEYADNLSHSIIKLIE